MRTFRPALIALLMLTAVFAGCFGDDGDGGDGGGPDGGDNGGGNATDNNTTDPFQNVKYPPTPVAKIGLKVDNDTMTTPPFRLTFDNSKNLTLLLDAQNSTDEDGNISAYAWTITRTGGFERKSTSPTAEVSLGTMSTGVFGVYRVSLKVQDDDGILAEQVAFFTIDYRNQFDSVGPMLGHGTAARESGEQELREVSNGVYAGTFAEFGFTVFENATSINATLTYEEGSLPADMTLFLFDPNATDSAADEPAAEGGGDSPVELTISAATGTNLDTGRWIVRCDLDGQRVDSFSIEVLVTYTIPPAPQDDLAIGGGNETGNNTA